jgi:outer membrane protein insertion porin family
MLRKLIGSMLLASAPVAAIAQIAPSDAFIVRDIRLEGLQRISEGTVYNYLPVNVGDTLDGRRVGEAIRALFATGFFRDIEVRRDGDTLVVAVLERPSIETLEIKGNKDIKTEDLQKSLRNVGLATGKTFDRSVLEEVKGYMTDQYFSRGKYAVKIDTKVEDVPGNKVKVNIDVVEGKRAQIRQINIVGNTKYKDKKLREGFELSTPRWNSWYKQNDRYSRESLQGDLEKLRSYYQDRGYANFEIDSTQVAIAPEKDKIYVTVNVREGDVYTISDVKIAGTMVVPESDLKALIQVKTGQTFSRKLVTQTQELFNIRLGADGYAFAKVEPVPTPDEDKKTISLTFFVDPGNRAYVRRVNYLGTDSVNDEVLRREMRQLEGSWLSNNALERSKERIQRLPYIEKVEFESKPVPGTPDLVDVDYTIKEGLPGQFSGGLGYSESQSLLLNGSFVHSNFMGRGERIAFEVQTGRYSTVYSFSHTNPYRTINGVARTFGLQYRDITQFTSASSDFKTKSGSASLEYGYPISEYQSLRFGGVLQTNDLIVTSLFSARQAQDWVRNNGKSYTRSVPPQLGSDGTTVLVPGYDVFGTKFKAIELIAGWAYDTRNRAIFADRGMRHSFSVSATVPGSQVEYYTINYEYLQLVPLWGRWTLALTAEAGYGNSFGGTTALPPFRQFFAGGPESVRGFSESRLGPKDSLGNPYGGNMKLISRAELLFPVPEKWKASARISAFFDIGNVFSTGNIDFTGRDGTTPVNYKFSLSELRQSAGVAVQWLAPLGIFRFSFGFPLNKFKGDAARFPDETESFQFTVGSAF